jgi:hypothetical protein
MAEEAIHLMVARKQREKGKMRVHIPVPTSRASLMT